MTAARNGQPAVVNDYVRQPFPFQVLRTFRLDCFPFLTESVFLLRLGLTNALFFSRLLSDSSKSSKSVGSPAYSLLRPTEKPFQNLSLRFAAPPLSISFRTFSGPHPEKYLFSCRLLSDSGKSGKTVGSLVYWITVCTNTSMESFLMAHGYLRGEGLPRSDQEAATHKMLIDMADIVRWVFRCRVSSSWQVNVPV